MSIQRNVKGITDFLFDRLEEIDAKDDIDLEKKIKMMDMTLRNVWSAANSNLKYKALMMRSPDVAKNADIILDLGTQPAIEKKPV